MLIVSANISSFNLYPISKENKENNTFTLNICIEGVHRFIIMYSFAFLNDLACSYTLKNTSNNHLLWLIIFNYYSTRQIIRVWIKFVICLIISRLNLINILRLNWKSPDANYL